MPNVDDGVVWRNAFNVTVAELLSHVGQCSNLEEALNLVLRFAVAGVADAQTVVGECGISKRLLAELVSFLQLNLTLLRWLCRRKNSCSCCRKDPSTSCRNRYRESRSAKAARCLGWRRRGSRTWPRCCSLRALSRSRIRLPRCLTRCQILECGENVERTVTLPLDP